MNHFESDPFLNKNEEIEIKKHNLPHWHQMGKMQYVTFHTCDSLPQKEIKDLKLIKEEFEKQYPKPWNEEIRKRCYSLISNRKERLLDQGYGRCILKNIALRKIVEEAILFYEGVKYQIINYVIMPNHVHLLVIMLNQEDINKTIPSILRFSANKINNLIGEKGNFWNREHFDRIVRSEDHLKHCNHYILSNPRFLKEGEYTLKNRDTITRILHHPGGLVSIKI